MLFEENFKIWIQINIIRDPGLDGGVPSSLFNWAEVFLNNNDSSILIAKKCTAIEHWMITVVDLSSVKPA